MCAQYTIQGSPKKLAEDFKITFSLDLKWPERILPYSSAPVIVNANGKRALELMQFSLIPSWSKEPRLKFSTYNARLTTFDVKQQKEIPIFEKPTWRNAFLNRRCLVPITEFIEPAYRGRLAGHMIRFFQDERTTLMAAGIWEEWASPKTGEIIDSFAILTNEPDPFIKELGHDRMPVFLNISSLDTWIETGRKDPKELLHFLFENMASLKFKAESDRPLKAGWEKRNNAGNPPS